MSCAEVDHFIPLYHDSVSLRLAIGINVLHDYSDALAPLATSGDISVGQWLLLLWLLQLAIRLSLHRRAPT